MKYRVYLNDIPLPVQEARTSRIPFNRAWPGHQRDISQTEISYFVSFDMTAPVILRVEVEEEVVIGAELRPREYGIPFSVNGQSITIHLAKPQSFVLEVNGYLTALHIFANAPYAEIPHDGAPNVYWFGPGTHDVGMLTLRSNETVYIDKEATVYGLIYVKDARNVTIMGHGILDSSRIKRSTEMGDKDPVKEKLRGIGLDGDWSISQITAYNCENLTIDGVILRDSPEWTLTTRNNCRNIVIHNVKIIGQWRYNSDGLDLCNSTNVLVTNCFIRSFDDCVVVRAPVLKNESGECALNSIRDCVLWCDWGKALEIWSGGRDALVRDIDFENIHVIHACHSAISIDTWGGSENIIVENVRYKNVTIDTKGHQLCPVFQDSEDQVYEETGPYAANAVLMLAGNKARNDGNDRFAGNIDVRSKKIRYRNIRFDHIVAEGETGLRTCIDMSGIAECANITFEDCRFTANESSPASVD